MTDKQKQAANEQEDPRQRIEEAREEAAAHVVQRPDDVTQEVSEQEQRIAEAVEEARANAEDDEDLDDVAQEAEDARDELKRQLRGPEG